MATEKPSLDPDAPAYRVRGWYITNHMMASIMRYVIEGIKPGDFLQAVICNDLKEAVHRADDVNINNLPAFVSFFYNEVPSNAWGSKEKMEKWLKMQSERWQKNLKGVKG